MEPDRPLCSLQHRRRQATKALVMGASAVSAMQYALSRDPWTTAADASMFNDAVVKDACGRAVCFLLLKCSGDAARSVPEAAFRLFSGPLLAIRVLNSSRKSVIVPAALHKCAGKCGCRGACFKTQGAEDAVCRHPLASKPDPRQRLVKTLFAPQRKCLQASSPPRKVGSDTGVVGAGIGSSASWWKKASC